MWKPRRLKTLWASKACYRDNFALFLQFAQRSTVDAPVSLHPSGVMRVVRTTWILVLEYIS
jgi:hypothetical protein